MKECELDLKDKFVQARKELYKCVSLSEFIKKDTFVQARKERRIVIHYFQFVNFMHLFQPSYSPLEDPAKLNIHCKPIGLLTKSSIELLLIYS